MRVRILCIPSRTASNARCPLGTYHQHLFDRSPRGRCRRSALCRLQAGLIGLTHFFASRLARDGITVNAIAPAVVRTDMLIQDLKASAERIPVGRFGTPTEVVSIVLSLLQNAYVTGQTISVNVTPGSRICDQPLQLMRAWQLLR